MPDFSKHAHMADVRASYRVILGRDIDPGAEVAWEHRLSQSDVLLADLREELLASAEYRARTAWLTVDIGGVKVVIDGNEAEFGRFIAHHGAWEPHVVNEIKSRLSEGDVFVDIGANVGVMSFHAARTVGTSGRVISFEPKPENVQAFLRGVLVNGFENVTLFPFGASDAASIFSLQGSSNAYLTEASFDATIAQCFAADAVLSPEPRIDFIKIDIEGHEPFAINGLKQTIDRCHPVILCEFNPRCLQDYAGKAPDAFADMLFATSHGTIEVLHHNGEHEETFTISDTNDLMQLWSELDRKASLGGRLPAGMLHLDLIFPT